MLCDAAGGVDYVLHYAAIPSVKESVENPLEANEINITGTLNVLLAARENRVKRFLFVSSTSVYGDNPSPSPRHEGELPRPLSPYAVGKLTGEHYSLVFNEIYGVPAVVLRYFNVYGLRQDPHSEYSAVVPKFINQALAGKPPIIYGDGEQTRDFIYIDDVVRASILALESEDAAGMVFNIASGKAHSVNALSELINKRLKVAAGFSLRTGRNLKVAATKQ